MSSIALNSQFFTPINEEETFMVNGGWGWKETAIAFGAVLLVAGLTVATGGAGALVGAAIYGSASGFTVVGAATATIEGIALATTGAGIVVGF